MSMSYEERRVVYEAAIEHFGEDVQIWVALEEMSELIKALAKIYRLPGHAPLEPQIAALVDELADVTIMMEQLRIIYGMNEEVQDRMDFKVRRLQQRIGMVPGTEAHHGA